MSVGPAIRLYQMKWPVTIACVLLTACGAPEGSPEEQVRAWLEAAEEAAEAQERGKLVGMISEGYADVRGNERSDIANTLRVYFLRQHSIELLTSIDEIRIYGTTAAEVDMTVAMAGTSDGVLGFDADAYQFKLELERDGNDWQLIAARWGDLGEDL